MLAVVDARENKARTHCFHIPIQLLDVQEIERRFGVLEEPVADAAGTYGT
jgi:hypothetical protein